MLKVSSIKNRQKLAELQEEKKPERKLQTLAAEVSNPKDLYSPK